MLSKEIVSFSAGDEIQSFFIIKSFNIKTSSNNKKYLDLNLADKTGEINGKLWDISDEDLDTFSVGKIVKIRGTITLWQNTLQLKIVKIRLISDEDEVSIDDLVPSAPIDPNLMYDEILGFTEKMKNEDVKRLVAYILEDMKEKLLYYPAAKSNHHSIRAGLLYHILRMLRSAEALGSIYTNLDMDLVYAGVILHDMEKINEMESDELGMVSNYTFDGQLLGHLIMGIKRISEVCVMLGIDKEISTVIEHMILSHHYEPEFGSPKKPLLPEAELLHYLDMIDARMYDMDKALKSVDSGEFTENIFVLDRRRLYKPLFNSKGE